MFPEELPHVNTVFLSRISEFLDVNLDDARLTANAVTSAMRISKSTLNRKLKALKGKTINEYIREYRIQKSLIILKAGYSIHETSHRVGFKTASYYTQCFKSYFHQTPSQFIRLLNQKA